MTTITVQTPRTVAEPRGSKPAARLFAMVLGWFERRSAVREAMNQRAERQEEANAVRQYAMRFASHDPRFAADLMAAADRHERSE